jgi:hypothetical protein
MKIPAGERYLAPRINRIRAQHVNNDFEIARITNFHERRLLENLCDGRGQGTRAASIEGLRRE